MNQLLSILLLLSGLAIGAVAAWLVMRTKVLHAFDRGKAAADTERGILAERLLGRDQTIETQNAKISRLEQNIAEWQRTELDLREELARVGAALEQEQTKAKENLAVLNKAQTELSNAFKRWPPKLLTPTTSHSSSWRKRISKNIRKRLKAISISGNRRSVILSSQSKSRWIKWTAKSRSSKRFELARIAA